MGVTHEHWCSKCKRSVDKKKEEYLETTAINDPEVLGMPIVPAHGLSGPVVAAKSKYVEPKPLKDPKVKRFSTGVLCKDCAKSISVEVEEVDGKKHKRSLWVFFKDLRKKGNPIFRVMPIVCHPLNDDYEPLAEPKDCETFEPAAQSSSQNCAHIAVDLEGKLYCKRRHPGHLELTQEKAIVDYQQMEMTGKLLLEIMEYNPMADQLFAAMDSIPGYVDNLHNPDPTHHGGAMGRPRKPLVTDVLREKIMEGRLKKQKRSLQTEIDSHLTAVERPLMPSGVLDDIKIRHSDHPSLYHNAKPCSKCGTRQGKDRYAFTGSDEVFCLLCMTEKRSELIREVMKPIKDTIVESSLSLFEREYMKTCDGCGEPLGEDRYRLYKDYPNLYCMKCMVERTTVVNAEYDLDDKAAEEIVKKMSVTNKMPEGAIGTCHNCRIFLTKDTLLKLDPEDKYNFCKPCLDKLVSRREEDPIVEKD